MAKSRANIELRIEELVLRDLPYDQRHRVAAALEQALTRLLAERGVPPGYREGGPLDLPAVTVNGNLTAETIGGQVADRVYGQMAAGVKG
jgi:hypothetical protein